jgi:flagellar basal body P-ring formation protein FlgA
MISSIRTVTRLVLACALQFAGATTVLAEESLDLESQVKRFLESQIRQSAGRKEIVFDLSDSRYKLPDCDRIEPFLPLATPPAGRVTVGLRCVEGAVWTAYRSAIVKFYGPAVVAARPLPVGHTLTSADYRMAEIELNQGTGNTILDPAELIDKSLARAVDSGQPLKRDTLRLKVAVTNGDPVHLAYMGSGFTVTANGKALGSASEGQRVRVQADNGRILTGVARSNRIIEVYF